MNSFFLKKKSIEMRRKIFKKFYLLKERKEENDEELMELELLKFKKAPIDVFLIDKEEDEIILDHINSLSILLFKILIALLIWLIVETFLKFDC